MLQLGDSARGFACCGTYRYYAFPALSDREAAMVTLTLTRRALRRVRRPPFATQSKAAS